MESAWGPTNVNNKPEEYSSSKEREARSIALEKAYVHDVYQQIASHFSDARYRAWPKVKQFLLELEPGSVVCDVGCGNGKYLSFNPSVYKIGLDRCSNLTGVAREKEHEVLVCDNLALPFRDECFDAVLSIAVIHHFATTERRVAALKELARVLRIGGRLMVSVWAMEQRHRKFESQDVLVPWNRPLMSSSDDKTSSIERDPNSTTTTTSDDDATHYHAYTQTSDSDSFPSLSVGCRKRGRARHRGRSIDPACPSSSQSSSDLSSPNESCYTFVRRALQKLAGTKRNRGGRRPWFLLQGLDISHQEGHDPLVSMEDDVGGFDFVNMNANPADQMMPIELRQLESTEFAELLQAQQEEEEEEKKSKPRGMLFSSVLYPRRRRTLETTGEMQEQSNNSGPIAAQPKSKSLSDLFGLLPVGILRSARKSPDDLKKKIDKGSGGQGLLAAGLVSSSQVVRSHSSLSGIFCSGNEDDQDIEFPDFVRHKAVQTDSLESLDSTQEAVITPSNTPFKSSNSSSSMSHQQDVVEKATKKLRPALVKQKHSICSYSSPTPHNTSMDMTGSDMEKEGSDSGSQAASSTATVINESNSSVTSINKNNNNNNASDNEDLNPIPPCQSTSSSVAAAANVTATPTSSGSTASNVGQQRRSVSGRAGAGPGSTFWKQTSLNEELIFSERLKEKERLKQNIQKQCSLNEELIYKQQRENKRWDQMKEAFLSSPNVKRLQLLKHGISSRFRGLDPNPVGSSNGSGNVGGTSDGTPINPLPRQPYQASSSLRNGLVRMLQNWKQGEESSTAGGSNGGGSNGPPECGGTSLLNSRRGSKEGNSNPRRGLFPPFFLRRSSAGSLNVTNKGGNDPHNTSQVLSPPPYLKRRPSDNELLHDGLTTMNGAGNKLLTAVRHNVRKLSREEGSDSSKDSSFQSDTSVDSEDSFASVIFIPKTTSMDATVTDPLCFSSETRANSTDSDRSPKSPASRLSPPNHNVPKSPSPLASDLLRRRSPELSPTRVSLYGTPNSSTLLETSKFVFDDLATTGTTTAAAATTKLSPPPNAIPTCSSNNVIVGINSTSIRESSNNNSPSTIFESSTKNFREELVCLSSTLASVTEEEMPVMAEEVVAPPAPAPPPPVVAKKEKIEKIEVLRKPAVLPEQRSHITRSLVRRSLPKALAVELFNPETDDTDSSDSSSSSPNSVSSVVSVVNDEACGGGGKSDDLIARGESIELGQEIPADDGKGELKVMERKELVEQVSTESETRDSQSSEGTGGGGGGGGAKESVRLTAAGILEAAAHVVSSLENLVTHSSPTSSRKRLGNTSEWLSSLPTDLAPVARKLSLEKRHPAEKISVESKKSHGRGIDAKWPASIIDEIPAAAGPAEECSSGSSVVVAAPPESSSAGGAGDNIAGVSKLIGEELEEKDSLYDSMENLTNNPSVDSSVRMSSTCSCSIRGGDSFDSWTSAKSSLTNSSSTHHKTSFSSLIPLTQPPGGSARPASWSQMSGCGKLRGLPGSSKSSAAGEEDTEDSTALTYHRYYHVFREGELDKLIEKYVQNLHIISSYYDHANWCIIAEKVQVWTI